jgi:hypothetical protein
MVLPYRQKFSKIVIPSKRQVVALQSACTPTLCGNAQLGFIVKKLLSEIMNDKLIPC